MSARRAIVRQAEINRAIRAAKSAGGGYEIRVEGDVIRLLPIGGSVPPTDADDVERRMREAFGQ